MRPLIYFLFIFGPWYRYLRALASPFKSLPFVVLSVLFVLFISTLLTRFKSKFSVTRLDKLVLIYLLAISISAFRSILISDLFTGINFFREFGLMFAVYFCARYCLQGKMINIFNIYIFSCALTVIPLLIEFISYNFLAFFRKTNIFLQSTNFFFIKFRLLHFFCRIIPFFLCRENT